MQKESFITTANAFLDNYNYYRNTTVNNLDITAARRIINNNYIKDLYIDDDGYIGGIFYNEICNVRISKLNNKALLIKENLRAEGFEDKDNKFDVNIINAKGFRCFNISLIKEDKCIHETCPYLIAAQTINACKVIQKKKSETNIDDRTINICNINNSEDDKEKIISIDDKINEIKNDLVKNEIKKIYNRISILKDNKSLDVLPTIYLVTGDNRLLKTDIINLLKEILSLSNISNEQKDINLLMDANYSFESSLTCIKNYEKLYNENYTKLKDIFLRSLYKLEESKGFVIVDTTKEAGLDLIAILSKNSIDIKLINLEIPDYDEDEIKNLFFLELEKLDFKIDESVNKLFSNGFLKVYIKKYSNLKNKPLVDNLLTIVLDNLAKSNKDIITSEAFPNILDKAKEQESIENKLSKLIGLQSVKKQLTDLIHYLTFLNKMDNKINMPVLNLHSVFSGSPGTGKTTIARIYANMLYELGYIKENKLVEVAREDLIAEYVGQTAIKTKKVFDKAMGGVLFIDEAYSLTPTNGVGFEEECIATIIKIMEDRRDDIVVIFAGYENDMQKFLDANEGLRSRINNYILFEDYSTEELYQILENSIIDLNLKLDVFAKPKIMEIIEMAKMDSKFGNGRYIMNLRQKVLMKHAINTAGVTNEDELLIITANDFNFE